MAYSVATLIQRVRRILQDYPWETTNSSDPGTASAGSTDTFTVPDGTKWAEGSILEFQDNGELCYVVSIATNTLTVIRGWDGTTTAAHASGTRILKNPEFTYQSIQDALTATIDSLWPYVWKAVSTTVTPVTTGQQWYNLTSSFIDLISVKQVYATNYVGDYGDFDGGRPVSFRKNMPTSIVASGIGVAFPNGFWSTTTNVEVKGRARLTSTIATGNYSDIDGVGFDVECLAYGAAAQLVSDKEVSRVTQEHVDQGDAAVVPLRRIQTAAYYEAEHVRLRNQWHWYLMSTIPPMMVWE